MNSIYRSCGNNNGSYVNSGSCGGCNNGGGNDGGSVNCRNRWKRPLQSQRKQDKFSNSCQVWPLMRRPVMKTIKMFRLALKLLPLTGPTLQNPQEINITWLMVTNIWFQINIVEFLSPFPFLAVIIETVC